MTQYQAFIISVLPATNTKGTRISIKDALSGKSITVGKDYSTDALNQAHNELTARGFEVVSFSALKNGGYILSCKTKNSQHKELKR